MQKRSQKTGSYSQKSPRSDVTGGLEARVLSDSMNTMIDKINELLEQVKTEQVRLRKAEFELLQLRTC